MPKTSLIPSETLVWLDQAADVGCAEPIVLRYLLRRLEALENDCIEQSQSSRFCSDAIVRRLESLEAAQQQPADHFRGATEMVFTPEGAPVATDDELFDLFNQHNPLGIVLRGIYNLGRQHGAAQPPAAQPTPPTATAGGLVQRVAEAMGPQWQAAMDDGELPCNTARNAICEVAAWLDLEGYVRAANDLREEIAK
jgi:hypothetical protein